MTEQEKQAQNLIIDQIESAFNLLNSHIETQGVQSNGLVSTNYVKLSSQIIVTNMRKAVEQDDTKGNNKEETTNS